MSPTRSIYENTCYDIHNKLVASEFGGTWTLGVALYHLNGKTINPAGVFAGKLLPEE
jgi:hypothetical protein